MLKIGLETIKTKSYSLLLAAVFLLTLLVVSGCVVSDSEIAWKKLTSDSTTSSAEETSNSFTITGPAELTVSNCGLYTVTIPASTESNLTVSLSATSLASFYSDSGCSTPLAPAQVTITAGTTSASFYVNNPSIETDTITASESTYGDGNLAITTYAALGFTKGNDPIAAGGNGSVFTTTGGVPPFTYIITTDPGGGNISPSTGVSTSPTVTATSSGALTAQVTDSLGNIASDGIIVNAGLGINQPVVNLAITNTFKFAGVGGVVAGNYTFSIVSAFQAGENINTTSGFYTAPNITGTSTVRVTDDQGNTSDASITTYAALAITPNNADIVVDTNDFQFSASGGVPLRTFSVPGGAGNGTINASGVYTAPVSAIPSFIVRVTDSSDATDGAGAPTPNTSDATVYLYSPVLVVAGYNHACALFEDNTSNGKIKCWGDNSYGQLGYGDTTNRGDDPGEMGANLPWVNVAFDIDDIGLGTFFTCVLSEFDDVTCWGKNDVGQLGLDSISNISSPGSTVNSIASVDKLSVGSNHACAIIAGPPDILKCWGDNGFGELGQESTEPAIGVSGAPGQSMSDLSNTPFTGAPAHVVDVSAGLNHTCAIVDPDAGGGLDPEVKCFGQALYGKLGNNDDTTDLGNTVNDISSLPPVTISASASPPTQVSVGDDHSCVLLVDGTVTCWGYNAFGQLGRDSTINYGSNAPGPTDIANLNTSIDFDDVAVAATDLFIGSNFTCVLHTASADAGNKCWGSNNFGQLGHSPGLTKIGYQVGIGDMTSIHNTSMDLPFAPQQIDGGHEFSCAVAFNGSSNKVYCWGLNTSGQLGLGDTTTVGTAVGDVNGLAGIDF